MTSGRSNSSPLSSPPITSREAPQLPPLSRHHSRSSSQLATLASLSLSPTSPTSPRQLPPHNVSPRSSQFGGVMNGMTPWSDRPLGREREEDEHTEQGGSCNTSSSSGYDNRSTTSSSSITSSSSSSQPTNPSTNPNRKSLLHDRRKTLPSVVSPSPLSHLVSTASTPSPVASPDLNEPNSPFSPDTRTALASLPPTDPTTTAQTSFPSSSIGLAQLIQQKRRQASAPYFNTARNHHHPQYPQQRLSSAEYGNGVTVMSGGGTGGPSNWNGGWNTSSSSAISDSGTSSPTGGGNLELGTGPSLPPSRSRSRHGSRRSTTSGRLSLQTSGLHLSLNDSKLSSPGSMSLPEGGGMAEEGMVMTPTTEEWRSLGGKLSELADLRAKDEERLRLKEEERRSRWEKEQSEGPKAREETVKRKRNPLRPSLWDVSSDEDDDDDEESSSDDLGLSLSLSRFTSSSDKKNKKKKGGLASSTPSSVSIPTPTPPPAAPPEKPPSNSFDSGHTIERPNYSHVPKSSFSYSSTRGGTAGGFVSHSNTSSLSSISTPLSAPPTGPKTFEGNQQSQPDLTSSSKAPDSEPLPAIETFKPTHRPQKSESSIQLHPTTIARPALSRGSLTSATGGLSSPPIVINKDQEEGVIRSSPPRLPKLPLPPTVLQSLEEGFTTSGGGKGGGGGSGTPRSTAPTPALDQNEIPTPYEPPFAIPSPARDETGSIVTAVDLDWTKPLGPVDPRTYSAVTGLRDISSFVVDREEAGKGAYGSVRRAREKGPKGQPIGPELIIKYVIKQRILADCWKKHKILGPIPIEVHVLDHLRRVPFVPRPRLRYMSAARERRESNVAGGRKRSGGGITRRDSGKPEVDLWTGGEDGGIIATGHPNVCGLLDFFEDGEFYYLVMPQATASVTSENSSSPSRGQDLFDFVDLHPTGLPPQPIARILSQVADALAFLHEHSIVHRDIKDENVVLDADGNVRLIDFGSAAYVKDGRFFDTFSGTLDFAAPEVLKGARYSGKEQDVWALGVLGYVLICGECPFWSPEEAMRGLAPDSRAFAQLQLKLPDSALQVGSPSPSPSHEEEGGELSMTDAIDLVTRCLEIDLSLRPSADAVCDHTFLAGEGGWRGRRGWDPVVESEEEGA